MVIVDAVKHIIPTLKLWCVEVLAEDVPKDLDFQKWYAENVQAHYVCPSNIAMEN